MIEPLDSLSPMLRLRARWKRPLYSGPYLWACHRSRVDWLVTARLWWTVVMF